MKKETRITLDVLLKRAEQRLNDKKTPKKGEIYVKSLDGAIVIQAPDRALASETADMGTDGDSHMVYECVVEPNLKDAELQKAYGCTIPEEIVEKIFDIGEISYIALECMKLAGYIDGVKFIGEVKN